MKKAIIILGILLLILVGLVFIIFNNGENEIKNKEQISIENIEKNEKDENTNNNLIQSSKEEIINIIIDNKEYEAELENNNTVKDIMEHLPVEIVMERYANHEFSGKLPFKPASISEKTSNLKAGSLYYWEEGNSFVINYIDYDISPYSSVYLGKFKDLSINDYLENSGNEIFVEIIK